MNTWILLRGLTREARHWGDFPALFAREIPGANVVPVDLPGNGRYNHMASPASIETMVEHCRAELARQHLLPPHCLFAMSMGAMVAAAWAERYPAEIERCVLVNSSFANFNALHQRLRMRAWPALLRIALARDPQRKEARILALTSNRQRTPASLIEEWTGIRKLAPVSAMNTIRQLFAAARFRAPARLPVPMLLLGSEGDQLVDVASTGEIARRWRCPQALHPDAGHDLSLDDGLWVAMQIRRWLAARESIRKL
ncbi:MAG: alpha/beta hydrolase [Betaproteobacteria bacterium]